MYEKLISIGIGYLCGSFLTAELVARKYAGKSPSEVGDTGNPGMANMMQALGFVPGIITLIGDLGKVIIAALLSYFLLGPGFLAGNAEAAGNGGSAWILTLYAGLGATLGHDFPFWRKFRGGKGVATTSIAIGLYDFLPGLFANILGMLVVFATQYLCIGGPVIPLSYAVYMLVTGNREAAAISAVLTVLSILSHGPSILGIRKGTTTKNDVLGAIRKKARPRKPEDRETAGK